MSLVKKYGIPVAGALVFTGNTACGPDPIFGEWEATSFTYDGTRVSMPYIYTYAGYEIRREIKMTVEEDDKDAKGEVEQTVAIVGGDSQREVYDLEGTRSEKGVWDIEINDFNDLEMVCTVTDDEMECDGENAGGIDSEIKFDRE